MKKKYIESIKFFFTSAILSGLCLASLENNFSRSQLEKEIERGEFIFEESEEKDSLNYVQNSEYLKSKQDGTIYDFSCGPYH